jgi:teichuronic acid biosynthesis glycosyltransferase TuaC
VRIAVLTTSFPDYPGHPAGHFVESEALLLAAQGYDVHVIAPAGEVDAPGARTQKAEDVHPGEPRLVVHRLRHGGALGWPGAKARVAQRPSRLVGLAHYLNSARTCAAALRADHLVVHWACPGLLMVPHGTNAATFVSHGEDVRTLCALPGPLRAQWVHGVLRAAEVWSFVSAPLLAALYNALSTAQQRALSRIARVRAPTMYVPPIVAKPQRNASVRRLISIGRLIPSKRIERSIAYLSSLPQNSAELIVVGDGPARTQLETLATHSQVNASFLGLLPRDQALSWLATADELLMASEAEGLSTVVREAEALRVPVRYLY